MAILENDNNSNMESPMNKYEERLGRILNERIKPHSLKIFVGFMLSWMIFGVLKLFGVFTFSWGWVFAYPVLILMLIYSVVFPVIMVIVMSELLQILKKRNGYNHRDDGITQKMSNS